MKKVRILFDSLDLSRIYDSKRNLIKEGYRKFFKKSMKKLEPRKQMRRLVTTEEAARFLCMNKEDLLKARRRCGFITRSTIFYWEWLENNGGVDALIPHDFENGGDRNSASWEIKKFLMFLRRDTFLSLAEERDGFLKTTVKLENLIDDLLNTSDSTFEEKLPDIESMSKREKNFLICLLFLELKSWRIEDERGN